MKTICGLGSLALFLVWASSAQALDDVEAAYAVCRVMDNTGLPSDECEVSGWNASVTVSMDTTASEARKICSAMVQMIAEKHRFETPWKLRIKSPYSGENAIATCKFK